MNNINENVQAFADVIENNKEFAIIAHVSPDGDAISSTVAMGLMLKKLGKSVHLLNEDTVPEKFHFLPLAKDIMLSSEATGKYDVVIALDCADYSRLGSSAHEWIMDSVLVNIDHHRTNDHYGKINLIDSTAAATVQILYSIAKKINISLDTSLSTALYAGLITDTGGYRYSNTTPDVMNMASDLISLGVSPGEMAERLLETVSFEHIKLLQQSLKSLQIAENGQLCWVSVTLQDIQKSGASPEDIDGIVNYPRNVEGVEVGLCFKEVNHDEVKVSFRSRDRIDVAQIAKSLGGGGHAKASGCTLRMKLNDAIDHVTTLVSDALRNS